MNDTPVQVQQTTPIPTKTLPVPAIAEPWLNLIHQIGLPWFFLGLICYYGYPIAKQSLETLNKLDSHATVAMPLLQKATDAIPLLEQLNRSTSRAATERHHDLQDLKASIPQKPEEEAE